MIKRSIFSLAAIAALSISAAHAQQQIVLSGGAKGGTYDTMLNQAVGVCGNSGQIGNRQNPEGSPKTVSDIVANQAAGGLVQFDVLWMRSRSQDLSTIKTLLPMHTEQVHLVALNQPLKQGGVLGFGGTTNNMSDIKALNGLQVGAVGGSIYTAQAINQLAGLGYLINSNFPNNDAVLEAVAKKQIAAGIFVGGHPYPLVQKLNKNFRLIPFDPATADKLKDVYRPRTVNYDNLGTAGIPTVEVDALLVVNNYKGKRMSEPLIAFRDCMKQNVVDLAETPGSHAAWRSVKLDRAEAPKWPLYTGQ